jgi:hypothetical protein
MVQELIRIRFIYDGHEHLSGKLILIDISLKIFAMAKTHTGALVRTPTAVSGTGNGVVEITTEP